MTDERFDSLIERAHAAAAKAPSDDYARVYETTLTLLVSNEFTDVDDDEFSDNEVVR
jgi:hypothetical protein